MSELPYVEASGTPEEIGHAVGTYLQDHFQAVAELHRKTLEQTIGWETARAIASRLLPFAEQSVPHCVAEMRGIGAGSGVGFEVLFSMNALQETGFFARRRTGEECSSLAVPPAGTRDGSVLMAHNEDAGAIRGARPYVVRGEPKGAPAYIAFTYSGLILHQGFNAAGIGSVGNALYSRDIKPGTPKLLAYRDVLYATYLEDAIRRTHRPERANGNNHLLASREGGIYDVEVTGRDYAIHYAGNRYLAHTNHILDPRLQRSEIGDTLNSRMRLNRINRLLDEQWGSITVETIESVLRDHANYPRSVCKHVDPEINPDTRTVAGVIIDLTNGVLKVAAGNPCEAEFQTFRL